MFFFYWLVAVMPLEQHWLWGHSLIGTFTVVKALGVLCLLIALVHIAGGSVSLGRLYGRETRWFLAFAVMLCLALLRKSVIPGAALSHVLSIILLFVIALVLVDSRPRLYTSLLVAIGGAAFASLYVIRGQQMSGGFEASVRPGGIMRDSNYYALLVGLWIPLAFLWAFSGRPKWERLFCFGCLVSMLLGTTFAASRGGFLGLVAAMLYLVARSRRPLRNLAVAGALMIPLLLAFSSSALDRLTNPTWADRQAQEARLIAWKAGLRMIRAHPLNGVGTHNFEFVVAQYEDPDERVVSLAHNTYVEMAAELGLPGFILYLGVFVAASGSLERVRRRTKAVKAIHLSTIALGLQAGLVSYLVSSFFLTAWFEKILWLLVFLGMCLYRVSAQTIHSTQKSGVVGRQEKRMEPVTTEMSLPSE